MYFRPKLPNGRYVPLPWQLGFGVFGILWPLQDDPVQWMRVADTVVTCASFCSFVYVTEAAVNFFFSNLSDIMEVTDGLATCAIYSDCLLRFCDMALKKKVLKNLLKHFYCEIYVNEESNSLMNKKIQDSIVFPIKIYSYFYLFTVIEFCLGPVISAVLYNTRTMPNRFEFHYEVRNPIVYGITLVFPICNTVCGLLMLTSDLYLVANFVAHLCGRYEILENDLKAGAISLINAEPSKVTQKFRKIIYGIAKKTQKLNAFAQLLSANYSFRIFSMILHGGLMLCAVTFQTTKAKFGTARYAAFVCWMAAKFLELLIFGELGSRLVASTNSISFAYYSCNWEAIIQHSTNTKQNVQLMREILLDISIYHEPRRIKALGFFDLSLATAAGLIRLAGSYYMFLTQLQ